MEALYKLKDMLMDELEEISEKGDLKAGDLDLAHKLTDTIKNIDKICVLEEDDGGEGYSRAGNWTANMVGSYGDGSSYAGRRRDMRGRYSRSDGRSGGYSSRSSRGGRGGYSRGSGKESMIEAAKEMYDDATGEPERELIRRFINELKNV